ncbi:MAG: NAD(P)H-hydrate epimerase, partial [Pseudomonadota bacterium]
PPRPLAQDRRPADHPTLPLADAATDGSALLNADLVIDALFGVGLTRALTGDPATIARLLRSRGSPPVLSVDIPSGVCSDTGIVRGEAFQATRTVTFVAPKLGHFLGDGALLAGDLTVAQIGAPPGAINAALENSARPVTLATPSVFAQTLTNQTSIKQTLAKQRPDAHKYDYGHAVVASGGLGASGAAAIRAAAASAAARLHRVSRPIAAAPRTPGLSRPSSAR